MEHNNAFRNLAILLLRSKQRLGLLASDYDITGVQAMLLLILESHISLKMSFLAEIFECDASNITGITERLEQIQLVNREQDPNDRRIRLISLTDKGRQLRRKFLNELEQSDAIGLGGLCVSDREKFFEILAKLA